MKSFLRYTFRGLSIFIICLSSCNNNNSGTSSSGSNSSAGDNTLIGAGSTFVYPLFSKQFSEYNKQFGLRVNDQSIGSGGGIQQLTNKTVDFGDSDAPLNEEQTGKI